MRFIAAAALVAGLLSACGADDVADDSATSSTDTTTTTTTTDSGSSPTTAGTTTTTVARTPTTTASSTTSTSVVALEQPAVWPAAGVVIDTPQAAATGFVAEVFGVPPNLGEFQQGDSRSGEIEVLSPAEGGGTAVRSVLLLRQLGPDDGWYVLAAVSGTNVITSPVSGAEVPAGPVEISGEGRGFEGSLVIEAFTAGTSTLLDQQLAQGGSTEATEPYTVTLDLTGASTGDTVLVLVRGGVGLETDTGEFSAIPLTIG